MSNQRFMSRYEILEGLRLILEAAGIPAPPRTPAMVRKAYERFKTGLSYPEVKAMLWSPSPDPRDWRQKSRGPVLGLWWRLKQDMWREKERREDEEVMAAAMTELDTGPAGESEEE
jgi:hypothetical protein